MGKVGVCCEYRLAALHFFLRFSSRCWMESAPVTGLHLAPHLTSPNFSPLTPLLLPSTAIRLYFTSDVSFPLALVFAWPRLVLPRLASSQIVSPILLPPFFFHLSFACNLLHRVVSIPCRRFNSLNPIRLLDAQILLGRSQTMFKLR